MNNEDLYIIERVGKENPFKVPAGYFDQLTSRVMSQLPEQTVILLPERKPVSRLVSLRPWLYAAACFVAVVVMGVTLYSYQNVATDQQMAVATVESNYMDDAADYAMLDNAEIYACLADY